jgi:hypothetical protein
MEAAKKKNLVDEATIEKAKKLSQGLAGVKQSIQGLVRELGKRAQPHLERFLESVNRLIKYTDEHKEQTISFFTGLAAVIGGALTMALVGAAAPLLIVAANVAFVGSAIKLLSDDHEKWLKTGKSFINWEFWDAQIQSARSGIASFSKDIERHGGVFAAMKAKTDSLVNASGWEREATDAGRIIGSLILLNEKYGFSVNALLKTGKNLKT